MVITHGRLAPEIIKQYESIWVPFTQPVYGGCGDDRPPTDASALELFTSRPDVLNPAEAFASIYGGMPGAAKTVMIVGITQYGKDFYHKVGGMEGLMDKMYRYTIASTDEKKIVYVLHSAEGNENSDGSFCKHGNGAVGCAYCAGIVALSGLLKSDEHKIIHEVALEDQKEIFGSDFGVQNIRESHGSFLHLVRSDDDGEFTMDRKAFITQVEKGVPMMILAGRHARARDSGLLLNFNADEIGSSSVASQIGSTMYRKDIMTVVRDLRKIFKEYDLSAELLARSIVYESTAVRAFLAANDADPELNGVLDPRNLAMGWRGNAQEALKLVA